MSTCVVKIYKKHGGHETYELKRPPDYNGPWVIFTLANGKMLTLPNDKIDRIELSCGI